MITYYCKKCDISYKLGASNSKNSECPYCGKRTKLKSELYWCNHCNVPLYDEECPVCHEKANAFTSDARPVFPEERLLVEILLRKPLAFIHDSVWNGAGNRYYVNGKKISLSISKLKDLDIDEIRNELKKYTDQNSYEEFDRMMERWIAANAEHFNFITNEAKQYIQEKASAIPAR